MLLIMGATGDAGHFETLADLLADEFTVACSSFGKGLCGMPRVRARSLPVNHTVRRGNRRSGNLIGDASLNSASGG